MHLKSMHVRLQNASSSAIDRSAWIITAFDSAPIADALPDMPLVPTASLPHDTMVRQHGQGLRSIKIVAAELS